MNVERVLVTGANGFLGQEIIRHVSGEYLTVATGRRPRADLAVDYFPANLLSDNLGESLPSNIDTIIHAAGITSGSSHALMQNPDMTRRIVDWGIKVAARNMILISSAAVYSRSRRVRREDAVCQPQTAYGQSKLESERYAIAASSDADMSMVILRKPALIGPTRNGSIAKLIQALKGSRFVLVGDGSNQKSLIDVSDAARACLATLEYLSDKRPGNTHRIFNVSGGAMKVAEIIDLVCEEQGRGTPPKVPAVLATMPLKALSTITMGARPFGELLTTVEQFLSNDVLDVSLFGEQVGFDPTAEIAETLREMVRYQY